jgi:hypothetical protein
MRSNSAPRAAKRAPIIGASFFPRLFKPRRRSVSPGFLQLDFAWRIRMIFFIYRFQTNQ